MSCRWPFRWPEFSPKELIYSLRKFLNRGPFDGTNNQCSNCNTGSSGSIRNLLHSLLRSIFALKMETEGFLRMAQESWKMDKEETGCQPLEGPVLCSNNCGFFGSATTMNLCSQCYQDVLVKQAKVAEAAAAISAVHSQPGTERQPLQEQVMFKTGTTSSQSVMAEVGAATSDNSKAVAPSEKLPQKSNRCFLCNKWVGLTGFKCRCGGLFCALHRYNDKHDCAFDYKAAARDAITKANPVIKADKIDKI